MKLFFLSLALIFFASAHKIYAEDASNTVMLGDPMPANFMEDVKTHEDKVFLEKAGRYIIVYFMYVTTEADPVEVLFSYNDIDLPNSYCVFDKIQFRSKSFLVESRTDNAILKMNVLSGNAKEIFSGMIYVLKADFLPGLGV